MNCHCDHMTSQEYVNICMMESIVRLTRKGNLLKVPVEMEKWIEMRNKKREWQQAVRLLTDSQSDKHISENVFEKIKQQLVDLPGPENSGTMGNLLVSLRDYILQKAKGAAVAEKSQNGGDTCFSITWKGKIFQFQLSFSPFWQWQCIDMPLVSIDSTAKSLSRNTIKVIK